jgi:mannan endo-1,4-beta-mannosidase
MKLPFSILNLLFSLFLLYSCNKNQSPLPPGEPGNTEKYAIAGNKIYHFSNPVQLIGSNAFHVFGAGGSDMNSWKLDIAREFVGNVKEVPLSGFPVQDASGSYLHSLQAVVDSNRAGNRITILCPFRWNGADSTDFTGRMPAETFWWNAFKIKLQQWATYFKDQPDVWLEVWNEPYRYDRADGYTDDIWMNNMAEMTSIIRATGNKNIILIPCAEQGQDESVLNNKGSLFLTGKTNILFDVHAYEKWLLVPGAEMGARLQQLKQKNLPVIFGETAPLNAGVLMDPKMFLDSVYSNGLSVCAWVWKYDSNDTDALLDAHGFPNNNNNNNWGTTFKSISTKTRKP